MRHFATVNPGEEFARLTIQLRNPDLGLLPFHLCKQRQELVLFEATLLRGLLVDGSEKLLFRKRVEGKK